MENALTIQNFQKASQGLYFLLIFSLVYSMYMITISNILLLLLGIIYLSKYYKDHSWSVFPLLLLTIGFLPYLQGLILSENTSSALVEIQHNLAYISIPIAVLLLPRLSSEQRTEVFAFFILLVTISTIPVMIRYGLNFEEITASLGKGKAIPTPIDHVRYSIFLAIACVFSFISYMRKDLFFGKKGSSVYLAVGCYLFIVLHILAVRSGIGLTYLGLVISGSYLLWKARKFKWMALLIVVMTLAPVIAYYSVPSFHNKIHYTLYDYGKQKEGKGGNYSDSERMRSYRMGLDVWQDHKLLGAGTGDLKEEIASRYTMNYPEGGRSMLPHNQFIKILASSGLIGLFFFLFSFYAPFLLNANFSKVHVISLVGMLTVSFMVEATLERSYMLALTMLFMSLLYRKT